MPSLCKSEAMRQFDRIELGDDGNPDATTILSFQSLIKTHLYTETPFAVENAYGTQNDMTRSPGTLVNATIMDAPSSIKNTAKAHDSQIWKESCGTAWTHPPGATTARCMPVVRPPSLRRATALWGIMRKAAKGQHRRSQRQ